MSVLRFEEEIDEETSNILYVKNPPLPNTTMPIPKLRLATVGPAKSGKTYALKEIEEQYLSRYENPLVHYMHMNQSLPTVHRNDFEFINSVFETHTRDYMGDYNGTSEYLISLLEGMNDYDLILVEDVRHKHEFETLRDHGFIFVYLSTPKNVRFKRAKDMTEINFMLTNKEEQLDNLLWRANDPYVIIQPWNKQDLQQYEARIDLVHAPHEQSVVKMDLWTTVMNKLEEDKNSVV